MKKTISRETFKKLADKHLYILEQDFLFDNKITQIKVHGFDELYDKLFTDNLVNSFSIYEIIEYEIKSHWLASWIWFSWGQELMSKYIVWKANRKYKRYLYFLEIKKTFKVLLKSGKILTVKEVQDLKDKAKKYSQNGGGYLDQQETNI